MLAIKYGATAPDRLDLVTTGATVQVDWSCTQVDKLIADTNPTSAFTIPNNGQIASATLQKVTTDPASGHEAMIREISAVNTHATASCGVQLQQTINGGTARKQSNAYTLAPGEKLLVNGDGTLFIYDASGGVKTSVAAALTMTVLIAGTAATYVPPAGCRAIRVRAMGGAGAGGGAASAASSAAAGAGGSSGGYAEALISPPAASYTYTIGAGGAAGATGANAGGNGGDTTFGTITAKGGTGGPGMAASTTALVALGPAGAVTGSGGSINMPGQPGNPGLRFSGTIAVSGAGAPSALAGGANGLAAQGTGVAAVANTGAGGGGGLSLANGGAVAGGAGGAGVILIEEMY